MKKTITTLAILAIIFFSFDKNETPDFNIELISVPGGAFMMGSPQGEGRDNEHPQHQVTLSDFKIGKYEITQGQWKHIMGSENNPSNFKKGDNYPVENVTWDEVQIFITKLNQITGKNYRLPTEAEWEYAARRGNQAKGYKYSGSDDINVVAWYEGNSANQPPAKNKKRRLKPQKQDLSPETAKPDKSTHPVGTKPPNELGIYDMTGNVSEWCGDWYGEYSATPQTNPPGPAEGLARVWRGGGWNSYGAICTTHDRAGSYPNEHYSVIGFRIVLPCQPPPDFGIELISVEGGTFMMGSPEGSGYDWEKPQHQVTVSSFKIGKYEITQGQWQAVMCSNPAASSEDAAEWGSYGVGANYPVYYVSWNDIVGTYGASTVINGVAYYENGFIYRLNRLTGKNYRLPTEAEWEYAARGGNQSKGYKYSGSDDINEVAWHRDNLPAQDPDKPGFGAQPVGTKAPNELGIYDMSGNVWEWCSDWWSLYTSEPQTNPGGASDGSARVLRSGNDSDCHSADRSAYSPAYRDDDIGFRIALQEQSADSLRVWRGGGWLNPDNYGYLSDRGNNTPHSSDNDLGFRIVLQEPSDASTRVWRGGGWLHYHAGDCRISYRNDCGQGENQANLGFRVVGD
jgi:formylglycine-generating enzyme required for sulfatase activity